TIAVIGVPVVDDEGRAERRDVYDRVTTVEGRNRAMIDFGFDPGVGQSQYATVTLHIAAPDNCQAVPAAAQELIIPTVGIEPQNATAPVVLQTGVEGRLQRALEGVTANPRPLNQSVPAR